MRKYKAKPTYYKDRLYRSRLEAKWAAMFDLLGWEYDYEPIDLNGWMPDFVLYGDNEIYVEIKPREFIDRELFGKIRKGYKGTALILSQVRDNGVGFVLTEDDYWGMIKDYPDGTYDIGSQYGGFDGVLFNKPNFRNYFISKEDLKSLWNKASNEAMYMKYKI